MSDVHEHLRDDPAIGPLSDAHGEIELAVTDERFVPMDGAAAVADLAEISGVGDWMAKTYY